MTLVLLEPATGSPEFKSNKGLLRLLPVAAVRVAIIFVTTAPVSEPLLVVVVVVAKY